MRCRARDALQRLGGGSLAHCRNSSRAAPARSGTPPTLGPWTDSCRLSEVRGVSDTLAARSGGSCDSRESTGCHRGVGPGGQADWIGVAPETMPLGGSWVAASSIGETSPPMRPRCSYGERCAAQGEADVDLSRGRLFERPPGGIRDGGKGRGWGREKPTGRARIVPKRQ